MAQDQHDVVGNEDFDMSSLDLYNTTSLYPDLPSHEITDYGTFRPFFPNSHILNV